MQASILYVGNHHNVILVTRHELLEELKKEGYDIIVSIPDNLPEELRDERIALVRNSIFLEMQIYRKAANGIRQSGYTAAERWPYQFRIENLKQTCRVDISHDIIGGQTLPLLCFNASGTARITQSAFHLATSYNLSTMLFQFLHQCSAYCVTAADYPASALIVKINYKCM